MDNKPLPTTSMQDSWRFLTRWVKMKRLTDYDWEAILGESKEIWEESGRDELICDVLNAFLKEIERRFQ